jgi:hypothetical protein
MLGKCALPLSDNGGSAVSEKQREEMTQVKIGVLSDMSGTYSDFGGPGSLEAAKLAIEDFNASSKKLAAEIVQADAQNKTDISTTIARRWFDTENVDMLVDIPTSGIALGLAGLAKEKNKVLIATTAGTSELTGKSCTPNSLHWTWDTWSNSHGTAEAVVKNGGKNWFFLTADYTFGTTMEKEAGDVVKANGGTVLGSVRHPLDAKDFSSFLLQAPCEWRHGHDQRHQDGGRVRDRRRRAEARRPHHVHQRHSRAWPQGGQRTDADDGLLLGPERQDARFRRTFWPADKRQDPVDEPRGDLFLDARLSAGGREGR